MTPTVIPRSSPARAPSSPLQLPSRHPDLQATKASAAQSRVKMIEKLKADAPEMQAAAAGSGPGDARKVALKLPKPPPCYTEVLQLKGGVVGWCVGRVGRGLGARVRRRRRRCPHTRQPRPGE